MGNKSKQFPEMEETGQIISEVIKSGKSADIVVESDSFAEGLVEERNSTKKLFGKITVKTPYIRVLRFVMVMTALVMSVTFILHYSIVYIRDVLFYKTELETNSMGAFTPRTGTGTEYGIFLFNTAELWANSGIRISKGDEVRISISGSFHSSFADLVNDSRGNNSSPEIRWIHMSKKDSIAKKDSPAKADKKYYLYSQWHEKSKSYYENSPDTNTVHFGTAFCAIAPEYFSGDPLDSLLDIHVLNGEKFEAKTSGVLRFAVNDVVLNDDIICQMIYEKAPRLRKDSISIETFKQKANSLREEFLNFRSDPTKNDTSIRNERKETYNKFKDLSGGSFPTNTFGFSETNNEIEIFRHYIEQPYKEGFQPWYDDNVGQLLACVEIQHPLKMKLLNPMSAYRELDKAVRKFAEESFPKNIKPLCNCILVFLGFVLWIMLICAVWTTVAFAIITAVYWIAITIGKGVGKLKALSGN